MKAYAELLERLVHTPSRNAKLALLAQYFRTTPDPDRGWALASLTGDLELKKVTPARIRDLIESRADPVLFRLSYDFVGDLAETASLIWPERTAETPRGSNHPLSLNEAVQTLQTTPRTKIPSVISEWMDALSPSERYALLKLGMGGMRVGVSARLARVALASLGDITVDEIEEIWFGLTPPYSDLFAWVEGKGNRPEIDEAAAFRPMMLANPLDEEQLPDLIPGEYSAEYKWDGIRVQVSMREGAIRLYSRTGDDITGAFPDLVAGLTGLNGVLDGELLVARNGEVAPFSDLQQRLGRKTVSAKMQQEFPAHIRAYDILFDGADDLRPLPQVERRERLAEWVSDADTTVLDLSSDIPFERWDELQALRETLRETGIEGLMLKRHDTPYVPGRPKGPWFKWKRDPLTADCVVMYAQRGHGRRSSMYSDFTFGCWRPGDGGEMELVPVGKAYSGYTDAELTKLDKWVRQNSTERYGPVRAVKPGLVFEVAFDAVQSSKRHKSGIAMRFPRIHRIRWDKPHEEADLVETLKNMTT